jgi:hypothetical protein
VLCVCLHVWDSDKCCVFVWMCRTQTSDVCFSGCVGLRQVLCVCLDVWDSHKCCVFVWMRGTQTSAVCLFCLFTVSVPSPGCARQRHSTCASPTHLDNHTALVSVPHIQKNTHHLSESDTSRQTHSTYLSPTHADKHTALV